MDISQIRKLKPKLAKFFGRFDACFPRKDTRAHRPIDVFGPLSTIPEKSVEPIAIKAGVAPRRPIQRKLGPMMGGSGWDGLGGRPSSASTKIVSTDTRASTQRVN